MQPLLAGPRPSSQAVAVACQLSSSTNTVPPSSSRRPSVWPTCGSGSAGWRRPCRRASRPRWRRRDGFSVGERSGRLRAHRLIRLAGLDRMSRVDHRLRLFIWTGSFRWTDMRLPIVLTAALCVLGGCTTTYKQPTDLAERLANLPSRPVVAGAEVSQECLEAAILNSVGGALSDPRGDVVMVSDDRVVVRLSGQWAALSSRVCVMALYSRDGYVGDIVVLDAVDDYVLGRFVGGARRQVETGDKATARIPYDAGQQGHAAGRPQAAGG